MILTENNPSWLHLFMKSLILKAYLPPVINPATVPTDHFLDQLQHPRKTPDNIDIPALYEP